MSTADDASPAALEARLRREMSAAGMPSPDQLFDKLRALGGTVAEAAAANAPQELRPTDGALRAALTHTFTLGELVQLDRGRSRARAQGAAAAEPADVVRGDDDAALRGADRIVPRDVEEQRMLLAHASTVLIDGRRRLMLKGESRARLISQMRDTAEFQHLLQALERQDMLDFDAISNDAVRLPSAWLRSFLTGRQGALDRAPAREARAAVDALECLREVGLSGPSLDMARRQRDLAELLEPLRLLIGQRGGWDGRPQIDRFVGREDELTTLRAFVDELDSRSTLEYVTRFVGRAARGAHALLGGRDEGVFFIEARGGLGKSTLIAKFMLDHALSQSRPFPFAYLDFDRAGIRPRDPLALLSEIARQVALEHVDWHRALEGFRTRLRDTMAGLGTSPDADPFAEFRDIIQDRITGDGRPFLLVLDTMEVVQYDPMSIDGIVSFQHRLIGGEGEGLFPELKIVASGRADVPELRTGHQERTGKRRISLKALGVKEARGMAGRLGQWLMRADWREEWARDIAGGGEDPPERREPLTLRVAVELMRDTEPEQREALAREIARSGEEADDSFVGRLYERRILSHIRDPDVRRLAWPGLVFRRVTPELIRDPLAGLCGVDPAKADTIFRALANEVWMVESAGAGAVRHRPDLRARTLPLMRRRAAQEGADFDTVNQAAIRYFSERLDDAAARAEWLYHRLLAGEDCASVDADWAPDLADHLRGAADDFERGQAQRGYLLSRTATRLLAPAALAPLPTPLALDHVAHTGQQLGRFDDTRIQPVILDLASRLTDGNAHTTAPHPARAVLLVKTGQWSVTAGFEGGTGEWAMHAEFAVRYLRARMPEGMIGARMPQPPDRERRSRWTSPPEADGQWQALPLRVLVQDLAFARLTHQPWDDALDEVIARRLHAERVGKSVTEAAALRTAIVFGRVCSRVAAWQWLELHRGGMLRARETSLSLTELRALLGPEAGPSLQDPVRANGIPNELMKPWAEAIWMAKDGDMRPLRVSDHSLGAVVDAALRRLIESASHAAAHQLRRYFAARDEDWLVPLGYALARVPPSRARLSAVAERLGAYDVIFRKGLLGIVTDAPKPPRDMLRMLRLADEASDLREVVALLAGPEAREPQDLLRCHAHWRNGIDRLLEEGAS